MAIKAVWKTNFLPVLKINVTIDIETLAWGLQDILNETNSSIRWKKKKVNMGRIVRVSRPEAGKFVYNG